MPDPDTPWNTGDDPDGATPLDPDEQVGLRLSWVATRGDLNAAEAINIARALTQRRWRGMSRDELLDDLVLRGLHRAMFGDVWSWAGTYRTTEKNIGVDPSLISVRVRDLCADSTYWFDGTVHVDEAGCRFHHQLVAIHPFPNGNGRHARAITDLLMKAVGAEPFTWGRTHLVRPGTTRAAYISALREADRGDLGALLEFARS